MTLTNGTAQHHAHGSVHDRASYLTIADRVTTALRTMDPASQWRTEDWAGGFYNATRDIGTDVVQYIAVSEDTYGPARYVIGTMNADNTLNDEEVMDDTLATLGEALQLADRLATRATV